MNTSDQDLELFAEWSEFIKDDQVRSVFWYLIGVAACLRHLDCKICWKGGIRDFRFYDSTGEQWFSFITNRNSLRPLLTKSPEWSYEKEYRLLLNPEAPPPYPIDKQYALLPNESISAIYLGARISSENRALISDLVNRGPFSPKLLSAKLGKSTFSLDFV